MERGQSPEERHQAVVGVTAVGRRSALSFQGRAAARPPRPSALGNLCGHVATAPGRSLSAFLTFPAVARQLLGSRLPRPPAVGPAFSNTCPRFCPQQTGPISATLVMTRPIKGPRDIELDLEMITVNTVINFRGSSVIRLRIHVSQYPF